jgi:hypothetical protein
MNIIRLILIFVVPILIVVLIFILRNLFRLKIKEEEINVNSKRKDEYKIEYSKEIIERNKSKNIRSFKRKAKKELDLKNHKKAISFYQEVLKINPGDKFAKKRISQIKSGKYYEDKIKNSLKRKSQEKETIVRKPDSETKNNIVISESEQQEFIGVVNSSLIKSEREIFDENFKEKIIKASPKQLSNEEINQLLDYLFIYIGNNCATHWQVNNIISKANDWNSFSEIRSLNDHGYKTKVKGILPKYFAIVCEVLKVSGDGGNPLKDAKHY